MYEEDETSEDILRKEVYEKYAKPLPHEEEPVAPKKKKAKKVKKAKSETATDNTRTEMLDGVKEDSK